MQICQNNRHSETAPNLDNEFDVTRFGYRCNQLDGMVLVSGGTKDDLPGDDEFKWRFQTKHYKTKTILFRQRSDKTLNC
jgi:hypothetical protein